MPDELKTFAVWLAIFAAVGVLFAFAAAGPAGCDANWRSWKGSAYGSDWLVMQYSADGSVISCWHLKGKAVHNEENSDGIFFIGENGEVVHLSGSYVYVQNPTEKMVNTRILD